jgi:hypothetical protein
MTVSALPQRVRCPALTCVHAVFNHFAALNAIAVNDAQRKASGAALPHMVVLEKFLAPVLASLTPREVATVAYLFSIYGHQMHAKLHRLLCNHLPRQLEAVHRTSPGAICWAKERAESMKTMPTLTDIPQACFSSIHGPAYPRIASQAPALAAWAFARQLVFVDPIFQSLADEITPWIHSACAESPSVPSRSLTNDSLLRVAWAFAKAGHKDSRFGDALSSLIERRLELNTAATADFTYEQQSLLLWSLVLLNQLGNSTVTLAERVFSGTELERRKDNMPSALQQQLVQTHSFLRLRAHHIPQASQDLPPWMWKDADKHAAPKEPDLYDALYDDICKHLKDLHLKHARQYAVDGFAVDVAFPKAKFGIEIVNKFQHSQAAAVLSAAPAGSIQRGHTSARPGPSKSVAIDGLDPNKLQYLREKGWYIVELDYARWRTAGKAARLEYLINLTRDMENDDVRSKLLA